MPETYSIFITRHAKNDLAEIYDYIAADSPTGAAAFVLELEEKISTLATLPERAPLIPENSLLGAEYRHLIHGRYRIIFRVYKDSVIVLRAINGSRLLDL